MKWFRFYHSLLDSVKVRTLPDPAQVDYTLLLCCASEYRERTGFNTGATGLNVEEAAWRMRRASLLESMPLLIDRGLARFDDAALIVMAGWEERQFASDSSAERERRSYDKKHGRHQDLGAGSSSEVAQPDGVPDVRPAAPDTETDTDIPSPSLRSGSGRAKKRAAAKPVDNPPQAPPKGRELGANPTRDELWAIGLEVLIRQGMGEKTARSYLGSLCSYHREDRVLAALKRAAVENPADLRGWLKAALKAGQGSGRFTPAGERSAEAIKRWVGDEQDPTKEA